MIDRDQFEERAAVLEHDDGMSRFEAETEAARRQGFHRWEAVGNVAKRIVERARDQRAAMDGRQRPDDVSRVQSPAAKEV